MKTILLTPLLLLVSWSPSIQAQHGRVFDNLTLESDILGVERSYALYLPPDYETSERSYPVLYLLQGRHDDHTSWIQFGEVNHTVDRMIAEGTASPMIIVTVNAMEGTDNYFNRVDRDWRYEDFYFDEFIPFIERTYRVRPEKQYRAVVGQSMGGGGALVYAMHRPDFFAAAAALAPSFELTPERYRRYFEIDESTPDDAFEAHWAQYDVIGLIENLPEDEIAKVRIYLECGDDDYLYERSAMAHIAMRRREIPHEYRVRDGKHNWTYWRMALPDVLQFVTESFRK